MFPDCILILNIIFGLIGITIGTKLMKGKIMIKNALLIEISKFIVGFLILFLIWQKLKLCVYNKQTVFDFGRVRTIE